MYDEAPAHKQVFLCKKAEAQLMADTSFAAFFCTMLSCNHCLVREL